MDYKKAYFLLFKEVSDTIDYLERDSVRIARNMLMIAQTRAEMLVISEPSKEDEVQEDEVQEDEVQAEDGLPEMFDPPQ